MRSCVLAFGRLVAWSVDYFVGLFFFYITLPLGPPFASLATKGDLSVALGQERVFEIKDRVCDLIALDAVDALPAPDGSDFRN
jgi:hypothetical protein